MVYPNLLFYFFIFAYSGVFNAFFAFPSARLLLHTRHCIIIPYPMFFIVFHAHRQPARWKGFIRNDPELHFAIHNTLSYQSLDVSRVHVLTNCSKQKRYT